MAVAKAPRLSGKVQNKTAEKNCPGHWACLKTSEPGHVPLVSVSRQTALFPHREYPYPDPMEGEILILRPHENLKT